MRFVRTAFAICALSAAAVATIPACSSDDSSAKPSGDGGADATAADTGGGTADSAPPDDGGGAACPTYTGSVAYCQKLAQHCTTCNDQLTSCALQSFTSYCESLAAAYNPALISAIAACSDMAGCGPDAGSSGCLTGTLAGLTPTAAQQKVAGDFCASCPSDAGSCAANFYHVATDGGTSGPGVLLLYFNDAIVAQVDSACTGASAPDAGSLGCLFGFEFCALGVLQGALPKNPCGDAAFADPIVPQSLRILPTVSTQ